MSISFPVDKVREVASLLESASPIAIITHHRPDGDAMGSSLGLYNFLIKKGLKATVIVPSDYPDFLHWLPGHNQIVNYDRQPDKSASLLREAGLIFCLDFNYMNRVEGLESSLRTSPGKKVLIDHHLEPEEGYDILFSFSDACSTAEIIYGFIDALGDLNLLGREIAECLYCGIMTDTNSFRYETMTADTHRIIAKLLDAGARNYKIHELVYDNSTENRIRLLGHALKDKLIVLQEYRTAYISLSEDELDTYNFQTGDTEGIVNYALSIRGIRLAAFFTERNGLVKISFRSRDGFNVKELASKHFEGGGHKYAAGGKSDLSLQDTIAKFLDLLPVYKPGLNV